MTVEQLSPENKAVLKSNLMQYISSYIAIALVPGIILTAVYFGLGQFELKETGLSCEALFLIIALVSITVYLAAFIKSIRKPFLDLIKICSI